MKDCIEMAFQRLRGYSAKKTNCDNRRFATSNGDCVLNITVPCDWKIPEESEEGND